jgi:hypothetical protein
VWCVQRQGVGDGLGSGGAFRQLDEWGRVAVVREGGPRLGEPLFNSPEKRDRRGPRRTVPRLPLRAQMSAQGQELGQVGDHADLSFLGDPHETVSVEIVAEKDARVPVGRREQASAPVVEQITLVDGLDAEREASIRERREDRKLLSFLLRQKCGTPERTFPLRLPGDGLPEARGC